MRSADGGFSMRCVKVASRTVSCALARMLTIASKVDHENGVRGFVKNIDSGSLTDDLSSVQANTRFAIGAQF